MTTSEMMTVEARQTGKHNSKNYRNDRKVPAVIYGPKTKNLNCLIDEIFVLKHSGSKHESTIFDTKSDDKALNSLKVMMKSISTHPVNQRPLHVDLYALDMTAKIRVHVPFTFEGEAVGVKEEGGVLQTNLRDVEIEVNPTEIPDAIVVDISGLTLNHSLHVSDVKFPAGVTPVTAAERTICSVALPKEEPAEEPTEAAAEGDAAAATPAEGESTES